MCYYFFMSIKKNINLLLSGIRFIIDIAWISFINILIFLAIFFENIKLNISALFSSLIEYGFVGYYVISILIYMSIGFFKLWFYIFKDKAINIKVIKKALIQTQLEKKIGTFIWFGGPLLLIVYFLIIFKYNS